MANESTPSLRDSQRESKQSTKNKKMDCHDLTSSNLAMTNQSRFAESTFKFQQKGQKNGFK
ncbi:hypothetical protein ACWIUD_10175 [Helicobacter sp. 23-1044]